MTAISGSNVTICSGWWRRFPMRRWGWSLVSIVGLRLQLSAHDWKRWESALIFLRACLRRVSSRVEFGSDWAQRWLSGALTWLERGALSHCSTISRMTTNWGSGLAGLDSTLGFGMPDVRRTFPLVTCRDLSFIR